MVLLSYPALETLEIARAEVPLAFPYMPGFLSFREGPAVLAAFAKLSHAPDLIIFDGQGIAHPRRLGIAAHLGVLLDLPSIGCAKSLLRGQPAGEARPQRRRLGASSKTAARSIGAPVRTKHEGQAHLYLGRPQDRSGRGHALGAGLLPGLPPARTDPPRPQRRRRGGVIPVQFIFSKPSRPASRL